ncbi:MAG TPA: type II secretion system protein [Candidatus Binatia bacterium]|nr:type II secretion system protein [Candidatus Binatia bacterium]
MSLFAQYLRVENLRAARAFTLVEVLVTTALAVIVGTMLLSALFFANRMWQITQAKIQSADKTRQVIRLVSTHVHSARILRVGSGNFTSFSEAPLDTPQQGNALQIHCTSDTNAFVRYFLDSGDKKLKYMTNGSSTPVAVAKEVVNGVVFRMEDFQGNVLTGKQNNCVINLTLDFSEIEGPGVKVGPGQYYQSFRVTTKMAQRTL